MSLISPEDFENGSTILNLLEQIGKWLIGTITAAFIAVKWSMKAGIEKRKYEELSEDVDILKASKDDYLTKAQFQVAQQFCQNKIEQAVDNKLHKVILEYRDELSAINANLCHLMGALKINPIESGHKRRRSDIEEED